MLKRNQFTFDSKIHQIIPNETGDHLIVHETGQKSQALHLVDLSTSQVIKELEPDSGISNLSVKAFDHERVVAISFSQEHNPDIVDLFVFDWGNPNPTFLYPQADIIEINEKLVKIRHPRIQGKHLILDLVDKQEIREQVMVVPQTFPAMQYPTVYNEESEYFEWFVKLLSTANITPRVVCEHLLWQEHHWISCYTGERMLNNQLFLINREGYIVESFLLASNLKGIATDTFFAMENKLIFVSEKCNLHVLEF